MPNDKIDASDIEERGGITRRALRVYTALKELRENRGDILDALIPFFEPILALMNGKIFDPQVFAVGVRKLYRWRFTRDIAENFIPRLERAGYLQPHRHKGAAVFIVEFDASKVPTAVLPIEDVLAEIIDEFEKFPPRVTDLLSYNRTRDELTDILIRFLVSLDAYNEETFTAEIDRLTLGLEATSLLASLNEGGTPLRHEDRYMCARFIRELCKTRPELIPHLAHIASIGLLTEVVEDFVKPVQRAESSSLVVVLDGPLALDLLGCSGLDLQEDVQSIVEPLRAIGCRFVVFPVTLGEIQRNLSSMLSLPLRMRHGYTHEAMVRGEVMLDYVQAVASDPEAALAKIDVPVRFADLNSTPSAHKYFEPEHYEEFFESVFWVTDLLPREHDATCLALTMRLRGGRHHSDVFKNGYVFVTRNQRFANKSREFCLENRFLTRVQEGPVIHQRELATAAWLRTGLGKAADIPRGQLIAACDRVLRVRMEVRQAVAESLAQVTPEKLPQYELLLQDQRSVRKLADLTLNDERVISAENAQHLLELMKQEAIAEEKEKIEQERDEAVLEREKELKKQQDDLHQTQAERDAASHELSELKQRRRQAVDATIVATSNFVSGLGTAFIIGLVLVGLFAILGWTTGQLTTFWTTALGALSAYGLYCALMDFLDRPKIGVGHILNGLSRWLLSQRLSRRRLSEHVDLRDLEFNNGRIRYAKRETSD
ncbi:MAG: hypothetical protein MPJ78_11030 [Hyphomicrobiaceae bacterium]|nr:hypothetical protein [Hyphomicrobiaceae bacterium]